MTLMTLIQKANFADEERVKVVETIKNYQDTLKAKDDEIQELKLRILKAEEEPSSSLRPPGVPSARRPSMAARPSIHMGRKLSIASSEANDSYFHISHEPPHEDAQEEKDLEAIQALEQSYDEQIRLIKSRHARELEIHQSGTEAIERQWELKCNALFKMQRPSSLSKVIEKQYKILGLLSRTKILKPAKDKETSVFLEGTTLYSLTKKDEEDSGDSEGYLEQSQNLSTQHSSQNFSA